MLNLQKLFPEQLTAPIYVNHVCYDSRSVTDTSVFVALKGMKTDGHLFLESAVSNGAQAIVVENFNAALDIPQIVVADSHLALAFISHALYHYENSMQLIGITGTDGKTSTATILYNLLSSLKKSAGYIGTNGIYFQDTQLDLACTTPLAPELHQILAQMHAADSEIVVMEVSSHALETKRVAALLYDYAIFTNFSHDHLDFHHTMAEYQAAKLILFRELLQKTGVAIINLDDTIAHDVIRAANQHKIISYSSKDKTATLYFSHITYTIQGMNFSVIWQEKSYQFMTQLIGDFNVYNIVASLAVLLNMGYKMEQLIPAVQTLPAVAGRMELFYNHTRKFSSLVDFAHAPNAIYNVLQFARKLNPSRLTVITGAVGNGDKSKRHIMGEYCVKYADNVIFTTDQPYDEQPQDIIDDMTINLDISSYQVIIDRETAIKTALDAAVSDEIVIVLGKGRETKIVMADTEIQFSDYEFIKNYMKN